MKNVRRFTPIALAVMFAAGIPGAGAAPAAVEHLPDLRTLPPSDVQIDSSGNGRLLRFSNIVANLGSGRMELRPQNTGNLLTVLLGGQATTRAYQGTYTHDAAGNWRRVRENLVGTFKYHPEHAHWHFEKFARYELFNVAADGSIGSSLNRVGEKTTFCLIDTNRVDSTLEHSAASAQYTTCGPSSTTGISVGWADKYGYQLDGQWLDIAGIEDGTYWLVSTVNYTGKLLESDTTNNAGKVKIRITGNTVSTLG